MKYAKELDRILRGLPFVDRIRCISYRKWKKVSEPGRYWKLRVVLDLLMTPARLVHVNLLTLYKICKRFEKRFGVPGAREFCTKISKIFSSDARDTFLLKTSVE